MNNNIISSSRRRTPWTDKECATASESFIDSFVDNSYQLRHDKFDIDQEIKLLNTFTPKCCPFCKTPDITKNGFSKDGLQRYICKECNFRFSIVTNTIFDNHKLAISNWIDFWLQLIGYQSFSAISKNNRNSYNTTKYWIDKTFLILKNYQDDIIFSTGIIYIDETYYKVSSKEIQKRADGKEFRGLSINQYCIGVIFDKHKVYCRVMGVGKPSKNKAIATYASHITKDCLVIHDKEKSHRILKSTIGFEEEVYDSNVLKKRDDMDNPLNPINQNIRLMKRFLNSHSGFDRDELQDYLNLFAFITNTPGVTYDKVKILLDVNSLIS